MFGMFGDTGNSPYSMSPEQMLYARQMMMMQMGMGLMAARNNSEGYQAMMAGMNAFNQNASRFHAYNRQEARDALADDRYEEQKRWQMFDRMTSLGQHQEARTQQELLNQLRYDQDERQAAAAERAMEEHARKKQEWARQDNFRQQLGPFSLAQPKKVPTAADLYTPGMDKPEDKSLFGPLSTGPFSEAQSPVGPSSKLYSPTKRTTDAPAPKYDLSNMSPGDWQRMAGDAALSGDSDVATWAQKQYAGQQADIPSGQERKEAYYKLPNPSLQDALLAGTAHQLSKPDGYSTKTVWSDGIRTWDPDTGKKISDTSQGTTEPKPATSSLQAPAGQQVPTINGEPVYDLSRYGGSLGGQ